MLEAVKTTSHVSLVNAIRDIIEDNYDDKTVEYDELESDADYFINKVDGNKNIDIIIQNNGTKLSNSEIEDIIELYNKTVYNQDSELKYEYKNNRHKFKIIE